MDLPASVGTGKDAHNQLRRWAADGTWEKVFTGRRGRLDHRPASSARCPGPSQGVPAGEPDDHALGRSRGRPTVEIHLGADSRPVPRRAGRPRSTPDTPGRQGAVVARDPDPSPATRCPGRVIRQPADQAANRKRRGRLSGRPPAATSSSGGAVRPPDPTDRHDPPRRARPRVSGAGCVRWVVCGRPRRLPRAGSPR
ncbi:hypothetical protein [Streptomyces sp. NPDC102283]|uniref:hypothetical protein n=1 Tax=Streptomyces sp. NPDC102283 TaxID=3366155 RepID=UPI0037FC026A